MGFGIHRGAASTDIGNRSGRLQRIQIEDRQLPPSRPPRGIYKRRALTSAVM